MQRDTTQPKHGMIQKVCVPSENLKEESDEGLGKLQRVRERSVDLKSGVWLEWYWTQFQEGFRAASQLFLEAFFLKKTKPKQWGICPAVRGFPWPSWWECINTQTILHSPSKDSMGKNRVNPPLQTHYMPQRWLRHKTDKANIASDSRQP